LASLVFDRSVRGPLLVFLFIEPYRYDHLGQYPVRINRITGEADRLTIRTDDGCGYLGWLIFEKVASAKTVFTFLDKQIGKPLTDLGSMDLPDDFCQ
jgi:hypothetical protein